MCEVGIARGGEKTRSRQPWAKAPAVARGKERPTVETREGGRHTRRRALPHGCFIMSSEICHPLPPDDGACDEDFDPPCGSGGFPPEGKPAPPNPAPI